MKKTILTLAMALLLCASTVVPAFAHNEDDKSGGGDNNSGGDNTTTITVTEADYNITNNGDNTITFLRADGTPVANATVTVKNSETGQEGDIEQNVAMPADGIFDYSPWIDKNVAQLRVTDSDTGATLEYMIETESLTISAGKNKSNDGGGTNTTETGSNMLLIGGGVVGILAIGTGFMMMQSKKKKAAFAAEQANKKSKKANA